MGGGAGRGVSAGSGAAAGPERRRCPSARSCTWPGATSTRRAAGWCSRAAWSARRWAEARRCRSAARPTASRPPPGARSCGSRWPRWVPGPPRTSCSASACRGRSGCALPPSCPAMPTCASSPARAHPAPSVSWTSVALAPGAWVTPGSWTAGPASSLSTRPSGAPSSCFMLCYRENVMKNLDDKAFDKPICEALLNQKFFNGIGNYLRAEILYRLKIPPFEKARTVLEAMKDQEQTRRKKNSSLTLSKKLKQMRNNPDLLELCHAVPMEVIATEKNLLDPDHSDNYAAFKNWLQCYLVPGMSSLRDHNGRTIWFQGRGPARSALS
ncbi:endonuclease 8-like 1 isoform X2 [Patagioenas fasciata]|uniref:endonuclease 8-like 1 isoform X2 n=1 Tax=Patagioenas fasciata TaxID=372321 RepID=UPI003A99DC4D